MKTVFLFLTILFLNFTAQAAGQFIYEGQIIKTDGVTILTSGTQLFRVDILNTAGTCLLYRETHTVNTLTTNGNFKITIGAGAQSYPGAATLDSIFSNAVSLNCSGSGTYSPVAGDRRRIQLYFDDAGYQLAEDFTAGDVPSALTAKNLDGKVSTDFLWIRDDASTDLNQTNIENIFSSTNYPLLTALINGSSTQYMSKSTAAGASIPSYSTAPGTPAAGSLWYDSTSNQMKYYNGTTTQTIGTVVRVSRLWV